MKIEWSEVQARRLKELEAGQEYQNARFDSITQRDKTFQKLEKHLIKQARKQLQDFRENISRPQLCRLQSKLTKVLTDLGFVQVTTPIIMAKGLLARMTIDESHPLFDQVYWLDKDKCLRPMLAPHLYFLLKDLLRLWEKPVRIFEIGPCFRKETQGMQHSTEFTMLNLVEMGLAEDQRQQRLEEFTKTIMEAAGLENYTFVTEKSAVYGHTIDIAAGKDNLETGSAAMGPHPLDKIWRISEPWVGIGFGLERLLMAKENSSNLAKMGRSLTYLNGIRLNI